MAKKYDAYICAGITEREGNCLYHAVAVVGPEGHVGTYRKTHLWNEEKLWFEPGNLGFPVFSLPFGKIGCRVCYDIWFPEVTRIYVAQGADIICDSTNWVVVDPLQTKAKPTAAYSAQQMSLMTMPASASVRTASAPNGTACLSGTDASPIPAAVSSPYPAHPTSRRL